MLIFFCFFDQRWACLCSSEYRFHAIFKNDETNLHFKFKGGWYFLRKGVGPKYTGGVVNFGKKNRGDHKIFDDQNVGSHKMTADSVFILFKKTDFNTALACLGGKVYR